MTRVYVVDYGRRHLYLRWVDPLTGKQVTRSSRCTNRRDAERKAIALENQLSADGGVSSKLPYSSFVSRYQLEHLQSLALRSRLKACGILDSYERLMQPRLLSSVTSSSVSAYSARLRDKGLAESTIAAHLRTLRAALSWAKERGFISVVPTMPKVRRLPGSRSAKGRPITSHEFAKMLRAAKAVSPRWREWVRLMRGLWLSGLRIGEAVRLRWTPGKHPWVDLSGSGWLVIPAAADKAHRDRRLPLTPDFAAWLRRTKTRTEFVMAPGCSDNRACKVISEIGRVAGVVVDSATGRTATAHDLRRSFAQRWASRLMPVDLQRLMRHGDIKTTMEFYLDADADGLATRLSNFSGNFPPKNA